MTKTRILSLFCVVALISFIGCEQDTLAPGDQIDPGVLSKLAAAGFDIEDQSPMKFEDGYLVEGDIYIPASDVDNLSHGNRIPTEEQYSTNNLVSASGGRVVYVYLDEGSGDGGNGNGNGKGGGKPKNSGSASFPSTYGMALDDAISRFNDEPLFLTFERVTSSGEADIVFTRLNKRDERRGILGSAGFPTSSGDPHNEIKMSGILESTYGLSVSGIATIMAHEIGHCIGFRHTDFFDRSISCGGSPSNEGTAGVGANHIPGTATGADLQGNGSWMLACTDGSNRPFTNDDQTALDYLY